MFYALYAIWRLVTELLGLGLEPLPAGGEAMERAIMTLHTKNRLTDGYQHDILQLVQRQ